MKQTRIFITTVVLLLGLCVGASASDRWETLKAINLVENPRNSPKPGPFGELGPYQFRERTWRMHSSMPFSMANQREQADEVAVKHYEWLRRGLERNGIDANAYNIALAWNAGLSAVVNGRVGNGTRQYARQVVNIVEELNRNQLAAIPKK